jgi:type II secretory pathway component PulF
MALFFVLYVLLGLVPVCGALYLLYFLLTLPLRRNERARMFLDALELGLNQGRTPEAAITHATLSRDPAFGARFYILGELISKGQRLGQALTTVPRLLPPQVTAMLQAGERIGDIRKVLPTCRQLLRDGVSKVRQGLNYVIIILCVATPAMVVVPFVLRNNVLPKYQAIFADMLPGAALPAFSRLVIGGFGLFTIIQVAIILFLWLVLLLYVGGPRFKRWVDKLLPGVADRLALLLPWKRKRAQRNFSMMLASLLDAGVPESEAVELASRCTANAVFASRAARVAQALRQGQKLPEAVAALDDEGEFRWRLANAARTKGGFMQALAGWHEALDAKAFQLEQGAAQVTTTLLVLLNGVVVACIVIGVFLPLLQLINSALW